MSWVLMLLSFFCIFVDVRERTHFKENPIFHIEILCPITNPIVDSSTKKGGMLQTLGKRERIHIFREIPNSTLKLYSIMNPVVVADEYSLPQRMKVGW